MARLLTWRRVLLAVLVAHWGFVLLRIPRGVFAKRLAEVASYRARGGVRFHLDNKFFTGGADIEWLVANVPEDAIVLYRGLPTEAIEFVPALIFPRLLWAAEEVPPGTGEIAGRPVARVRLPGKGEGDLVVVGHEASVELEVR